jgi:hypothetical protein
MLRCESCASIIISLHNAAFGAIVRGLAFSKAEGDSEVVTNYGGFYKL